MAGSEPAGRRVDLAHEPDFQLGPMSVSPSTGRVRTGGVEERLEPRMMQVLVVLARAGGATVSRDELVEACWEGRIVSDDAIARIVAKVRNLARATDPPAFAIETIPKVGFRLMPGDAGPVGREATESADVSARRMPVLAALAVLVLAGAAWLGWSRFAPPPARPGPPSLTEVIAFEARGEDPALRTLAVDTGEALVRVMSAAGMEVAPQLGRKAEGGGGDAVFRITGSVSRDADSYVANAQFLDRPSGVVLWSARIEHPAAEMAAFHETAAYSIAAPIQCAMEDRRRFKRPMPASLFALYLNACDSVARQGGPERMLGAATRLVQAAPGESTALAMLGIAQGHVAGLMDYASRDEVEAMRSAARASADRALRLDPETPKAYIARALSYPLGGDWDARERDLRRVQEIDPAMGPGRVPLIFLLREVGRLNEARQEADRAAELADPRTSVGAPAFRAFLAAQVGDLEAAREVIAKVRRGYGREGADGIDYTVALWWDPDLTRAREIARRTALPRDVPCVEAHLARIVRGARGGVAPECRHLSPEWRIRMMAREGDLDGAYREFAARFAGKRRPAMFLFHPELKAFRADPRFMPLARDLGLVEYWSRSGRWPDFCAEPDLPYDCRRAASSAPAKRS